MLKNWVLVALRNLLRHKLYTAINVLGLAVGLASCLLIMLHVRDELSYDAWVPDAERIVRVHSSYEIPGRAPFRTVRSAGRMMEAFATSYPEEVEAATRMVPYDQSILRDGQAIAQTVTYVDPAALVIFGLSFVAGDAANALSDPSSLILTQSAARKYFGDADPIGRTLTLCCIGPDRYDHRVTAVIADLPRASHLKVEMLAPLVPARLAGQPNILDTWTSVNVFTYLKLRRVDDIDRLRADNPSFIDRMIPNRADGSKASTTASQKFMPIRDIRLHARAQAGDIGDMKPGGDAGLVAALSLVALLILALGCVNFTNMAVARSSLRGREVAVRKVLGARRRSLVAQFLTEGSVMVFISVLVALGLMEVALPAFNGITGKTLSIPLLDPAFLAALGGLTLLVTILGGAYPALYLSGFKPARILKGENAADGGGARLRGLLVVLQFSVAIGLSIITLVVYRQTLFASTAELGFDRQHVLALRGLGGSAFQGTREAVMEEVRRLPGVTQVALSSDVPTDNSENNMGFLLEGSGEKPQVINYQSLGDGFFDLYKVAPVAGRLFDPSFGADLIHRPADGETGRASTVVNEAAARLLGFANPADAVGRVLKARFMGEIPFDLTIVGIIPDIRFRSLKYGIQPTVMFQRDSLYDTLSIRFDGRDPSALLSQVQAIWARMISDRPFSAAFVEDMIAAQYNEERVQATVFATFSGLAILVACLGLYGLSGFAARRRTKEIGLRKVFGATVAQIVALLVWQFSRPVMIANIVAWPVAWWLLRGWLDGFEQRVALSPAYFVAAGLVALVIAWITVAGHAAVTAMAPPIKALRHE
ncbi:ABC transporter permease [Niveispirillum sp. KHB5.9]|uniref:ABC transporter permease n=1 Tax=Niveispirillum sp. KHB5.9 TaxID=3400269 RepID=UPI003A8595ED